MKRATFGDYREALTSTSNFGGLRLSGDVDHALSSGIGVRINGIFEDGDSFRRHVDLKRYGVNPTVAIQAGPEHAHRRRLRIFPRSPDRRPRRSGERRPAARRPSTATSSAIRMTASRRPTSMSGRSRSSMSFADGLTIKNRTTFADYDKFYQNIYPERVQRGDRTSSLWARTTARTTGRICSARPTWFGKTGSAASTRPCCSGSRSAARSRVNHRMTGSFLNGATTPLSDPTVDKNVTFASVGERRQQPHPGDRRRDLRPGPDPADRLARDRRRPAVRQLQAERQRSAPGEHATSAAGTSSGRRASA